MKRLGVSNNEKYLELSFRPSCDLVIPGNDDSSRAIRLYARGMADAVLDGKNKAITDLAKSVAKEQPVETPEEE